MRFLICLLVISSLFIKIPGLEGGRQGKLSQKIPLPSQIEGWKWNGDEETYNSQTIFDYIDGAGELYRSYNFQNLRIRRFAKPAQPSITLELYDMGSSEDAYGIFSFERQDEEVNIGQGSEYGGGLLRFWKERYFVNIYSETDSPELKSVIFNLGRMVADSIKRTGPAPKLIKLLPESPCGLIEKSVLYFHNDVCLNQRFFVASQNILNLGQRTNGVIAQYLRGQNRSHLLLVQYPAEKLAEEALQSFSKAYLPEVADKGRLQTEDGKWTVANKHKEYLLIVFGASNLAEAEDLLGAAENRLKRQ